MHFTQWGELQKKSLFYLQRAPKTAFALAIVQVKMVYSFCGRGETGVSVLYLKEQGAYVQKIGDRIIVTKSGQTLLDIPVFQVDNIAIIGNVQITTQALHMLMLHGVDVSYFTRSGGYLGMTAAESARNIFLRFEQYRCFMEEQKRMEIARCIVDGKIRNQMDMIRTYRWTGIDHDWHSDLDRMEQIRQSIPDRADSHELMGTEGVCSQIYFGAFAAMLKCNFRNDSHVFRGRNRRPPKDPVNVILSLAYTFLTREVCSVLEAESFEPYLGFLHGIRYGRKSLALDLVEEFRQPAVDRLVLMLFNKQMLSSYDFDFDEGENRVILNEEGYKTFCREYERWMSGRNSAAGDPSFRNRIRQQVAALRKTIQKGEPYITYSLKRESEVKEVVSENAALGGSASDEGSTL